ncbi:MAG: FAD/NAD(P)-binding protein [Thiobacillus sp.]|jgi:NAD(P)H-flavin reductase|uniref:FAD/NAD(P)-binding protein n=1 Tax=Thiobacillus sp. TaxID=924 RepID=UPI0028956926|nr:FAD/NAD(P)-binding protein [Thiobacillus sp.]MDT3706467.1 FAD/NAD(P)-binding protein [Thiobacillus sp.]
MHKPIDAGPPHAATVVAWTQESPTIFTLQLRLDDEAVRQAYRFAPGQFNMLYLYGVGEVPISVMSDPEERGMIGHTVRALGRVTHGLAALGPGDKVGLRGPFGRGWPLQEMGGCDVVLVTGGLGCAPAVSVIHYVLRRRERFGKLVIIQGVKHAEDLIWREQYDGWARLPNTQVLVAADQGSTSWPWHVGYVTDLLDLAQFNPARAVAMMCGPEGMMRAAAVSLLTRALPETHLFLSMERNMHCAVGRCGHCQFGGAFVCRDGPVFGWSEVRDLLAHRGY